MNGEMLEGMGESDEEIMSHICKTYPPIELR
jgi:hypothetical protein